MKIIEVIESEEPLGNLAGEVFDPHHPREKPLWVPRNDPTPRNPAVSPTSGVITRKDPMIPAPLDPMFEGFEDMSFPIPLKGKSAPMPIKGGSVVLTYRINPQPWPGSIEIVAYAAKQPVGELTYTVSAQRIHDMGVAQKFQRRGINTAMHEYLESILPDIDPTLSIQISPSLSPSGAAFYGVHHKLDAGKNWRAGRHKVPEMTEAASPMFEALDQHSVLYHYTGAWHLVKIFAEKRISFTVAVGSDIQAGAHNAEKIYFLSCTRSKIGRYSMAHEGANTGVVLVLNRDWLQHNLTVRPVDYWGREFRKADPRGNEMEERVYSREPYLPLPPNTKDLILAIHLYIAEPDERYRASLFGTVIGAKQLGVPLFAYQDKRAWLLQDTRRALPSTQLISILKTFPHRPPSGGSFRRPGDFGGYVELFLRPVEDQTRLTKAAKRVIRNLTPYYLHDVFRSLEADIHNTRSPGSIGHDNLIRFMQFLQQNGFNNIKDFIEFLSQKWYGKQ